jgi:type IV pilus assembly protein PilA
MLRKLRERAQAEQGFTLIELLVVILIIGILAAIAIPSFLNQKNKGNDAEAKSAVVTAAQAMETCATDNNGDYSNCNFATIRNIEPTLNDVSSRITVTPNSTTGYTVQVQSTRHANVWFNIVKTNGATERNCQHTGQEKGGCPNSGVSGNDW